MPREPNRSKKADWGLTTAATSAKASTQVSANRSSDTRSSASPQSSSRAACGSIPIQAEPRLDTASVSRLPKLMCASPDLVRAQPAQAGLLGLAAMREADRIGHRGEPATIEFCLQFLDDPDRRGRIVEHRRADRYGRGASQDELQGILTGADPSHPE